MESKRWNLFWAVLTLLAAAWGFTGCTAHVPAPETETVGQLAAGPSVYVAPLKHDAPPELGLVVDTESDDVSAEVTTTTRVVSDAGSDAEAPDVTEKASHGF